MSHQRLRRPRQQPTSAQPTAEAQQPSAAPISLDHSFGAVPLHGLPIQAKLTVGAADDPYEREADRVADQVMAAPDREIEEQATAAISPLDAGGLRTSREGAAGSFEAGAGFEQQLGAAGGGSPLPEATRAFMEPRFGADFSGVRIHTGGESAQLNRQVSAQAFTHGSDIYMGEGHTDIGSGAGQRLLAHELTHVVQQTGGVARKPVVQRKLGGALAQINEEGLRVQLVAKGISIPFKDRRALFAAVQSSDQDFTSIDDVLRAFQNQYGLPAFSGSAEAAPSAEVEAQQAQPVEEKQPAEKQPEEEKQSAPPLAAIAKASEEAQQEVQQEVAKRAQEKPKQAVSGDKGPAEAEQSAPEAQGGGGLIINYVWFGNNKLGALEKFNIYSWRALGHTVNIYIQPFGAKAPHTVESLGLEAGDANIIDLSTTLGNDNSAEVGTPQAELKDARSILNRWLHAARQTESPKREHIYNMVDLTKSYLGGTQQGIVLDMKVGPSPHLQAYAESFNKNFISYSRGGNTAGGLPENQSIGTMQESEELRLLYAKAFNAKIQSVANENHNDKLFDKITGYHGQSHNATGQALDVATQDPSGKPVGDKFPVGEIGPQNHGPFRVFKAAGDQSNKAGSMRTDPRAVFNLADDVLKRELMKTEGANKTFIAKAKAAQGNLPRPNLW
ncbi:DUF4157 domain-containing protein [Chloroflexia bacterium SDU3-3]|nr:DUF4157 domain-containing protein [Chloroflexia bacterium SDU3-3]